APPFRWGLHRGAAVFGSAATAGELSTLGQDLNFLFRLERLAATNKFPCVISAAACEELGELCAGTPLGSFPLKGFEGEHALYGCEPAAASGRPRDERAAL
ncbi:MAG: hypothetical protein M3Y03_03695, partial [Verrucomicrobiota bacterium]|nr:hypothetical protein [Verrucomicrobiota bacterium]